MSDIPALSFSQLINLVQGLGFVRVRQRGSHIRFVHPDGRKTTVPDHGHKIVPKGLLAKIIRYDLEMTTEEFFGMLR